MTLSTNSKLLGNKLFEAIHSRHSVRAFKPGPVDKDSIQVLLDAAVRAPTAQHIEPWSFVVVQNGQLLKELSDLASPVFIERLKRRGGQPLDAYAEQDFNIFYDASTLIIVCANIEDPYAEPDCWLAAENVLLAAWGLGLGGCIIGSAIQAMNLDPVKKKLGIPSACKVIAPIVIGVPQVEPVPSPRKAPVVHGWL